MCRDMQATTSNRQPEIEELIHRLDLSLVEPDPDYDSDDSGTSPSALDTPETVNGFGSSGSIPGRPTSASSSATSTGLPTSAAGDFGLGGVCEMKSTTPAQCTNGNGTPKTPLSPKSSSELTAEITEGGDRKTNGKFDLIRKLRGTESSSSSSSSSSRKSSRRKTLERLRVDSLPQSFVAKYIGCKACRGLWGIQYTREPVDSLVDDLRRLDRTNGDRRDDLPLVRVDVAAEGIAITVHPRNRSSRPISDIGLLPLEFISYAVQDTRYSRIFAFVLVRELSSRARATECHAFLCDTAATSRTLALSAALAFRAYEQKLAGRPFKFVVDLRWPDELESELNESQRQQQRLVEGSKTAFPRAEFEV